MRTVKTALMINTAAAAFASAPATEVKATKPRVEPVLTEIVAGIPLPKRTTKRGSVSLYNFDGLEVGACFGAKNKTAANLSSIVSNANRKALVQSVDAEGKPIFGTKTVTAADGTVSTVPDLEKPAMTATKHFVAVDVDTEYKKAIKGTALEGSSVLVFRDK